MLTRVLHRARLASAIVWVISRSIYAGTHHCRYCAYRYQAHHCLEDPCEEVGSSEPITRYWPRRAFLSSILARRSNA